MTDETVILTQAISTELIAYLARHPKKMYELGSRQFEELIAEILKSFRWEVELTASTKDGGYDMFAVTTDSTGLKSSWVVECKKYREDRKVGIEIANALYGVKCRENVANALLATTSYFTQGVHQLKASRYDFELRDYDGILEWLGQVTRAK